MPSSTSAVRQRILVVDDDPDILELERLHLQTCGYEIVSADRTSRALELLATQTFDLAILDFDLGHGETGVALAQRIRDAGHDVPAIMLTALAGDQPVIGALRAGLRDFVRKGEGFLKQLEETVPRVIAQAAEERRVKNAQALDRFAEGMSHNLNNMLTTVIGFSELELRQQDQSSPTRLALERILNGGRRAAELVKQLSAAGQRVPMTQTHASLMEEIEQVEDILNKLGRSEILVQIRASADLGGVLADPNHVHQILLNLSIRACDGMREGGTLRFEAENLDLADAADGVAAGRYVKLTVSDTGPALDEATLRHAFEPFHDVRAKRHGSGLELAAAYGFVQLNKGHIALKRSAEGGCAIEVLFVRAD